MKKQQLRITGWPAVHRELARLDQAYRAGLTEPVGIWIQFSNGNTVTGRILFAQSNDEYLVLDTGSDQEPFARYLIQEIRHDYTGRLSMKHCEPVAA